MAAKDIFHQHVRHALGDVYVAIFEQPEGEIVRADVSSLFSLPPAMERDC